MFHELHALVFNPSTGLSLSRAKEIFCHICSLDFWEMLIPRILFFPLAKTPWGENFLLWAKVWLGLTDRHTALLLLGYKSIVPINFRGYFGSKLICMA